MMYIYLFFFMNFFMACSTPSNESDSAKSESGIEIKSNKATYDESEKIVITVWNRMEEPVTTMDQHTNCSIILIEQQKETGWQEIKNCTLNAPAREVTIPAGSKETIELISDQPFATNLTIGTYRATLVYTTGEHFKPSQHQIAISDIFTVE